MRKKTIGEMSFLDHLEELRWHLIRSILAIMAGGLIAFLSKGFIFNKILFGLKNKDFITYRFFCKIGTSLGFADNKLCFEEIAFRIQSRTVAGQFSAHIWTSIAVGFIISFPYILFEVWRFISPGLYKKERKNARGFIIIASLLFFVGICFGYFVVAPLSINFLGSYNISEQIFNDFDLGSYIGLVRASVLSCGFIFELPILIYFFTKIGLITPEFLMKKWKISLIVILSLSAIITPPDVISQLIVGFPLFLLYWVSYYISKIIYKKQQKKENYDSKSK